MAKISITERAQAFMCTRKNSICNHSRKHNMSVSISVWCWHGITHLFSRLESQ